MATERTASRASSCSTAYSAASLTARAQALGLLNSYCYCPSLISIG